MLRTFATGKQSRSDSGFTLLELMVVMAIMVLMISAIPISINHMLPGRRVAVAAERISSAIRDAQAHSALSGLPVRFEVSPNELRRSYATASAQAMQSVLSTSSSTMLSATTSGGRPQTALSIFPDGGTSGGAIDIADGTHRAKVSVSVLTGRVTIDRDQ